MKSLFAFALLLIVCSLCDPTRSSPSGNHRVRRQGWAWGDENNDSTPPRPRPTSTSTSTSTSTTTQAAIVDDGTTTTPSPQFTACFNACQTTLQFNPVCGSNRVTYENEGRLKCAIRCGAGDVTVLFLGTCNPARK